MHGTPLFQGVLPDVWGLTLFQVVALWYSMGLLGRPSLCSLSQEVEGCWWPLSSLSQEVEGPWLSLSSLFQEVERRSSPSSLSQEVEGCWLSLSSLFQEVERPSLW